MNLADAFFTPVYNQIMRRGSDNDLVAHAYRQRHHFHWNVGFCDSHVENLKPARLFDLTSDRIAQRWNVDHQPHNQLWHPPPP